MGSEGGSGEPGGKGRAGAGPTASVVGIPSYWRGGFVPLGEDEMQAMKIVGGEEALEEYLVKRYACCGGWNTGCSIGFNLLQGGGKGSECREMGAVSYTSTSIDHHATPTGNIVSVACAFAA